MATGTGLGNLVPVAMTLVGIVSMLRARTRRRSGTNPPDADVERRQAAAADMERRMASYLAERNTGGTSSAAMDPDEQENRQ